MQQSPGGTPTFAISPAQAEAGLPAPVGSDGYQHRTTVGLRDNVDVSITLRIMHYQLSPCCRVCSPSRGPRSTTALVRSEHTARPPPALVAVWRACVGSATVSGVWIPYNHSHYRHARPAFVPCLRWGVTLRRSASSLTEISRATRPSFELEKGPGPSESLDSIARHSRVNSAHVSPLHSKKSN